MSKKVLKLAGRRPMLLAVVMATLILGLLFSGWLTPTPSRAQTSNPNPTANQENTNCVATTNAWSGTCPTVITNSSVSPTSIVVCYSNAPTMPTNIIAPVYSPTNIFTQLITYSTTNCITVTNTENVTYSVSGIMWTNFTSPYTNFPAHVTNQFSVDADVYVTSSDTNACPSPGLINLATVTWYPIQVTVDAPDYDPDAMNANVRSMDSCGCGLGDATIWWFNGEKPDGYVVSTKASVTGVPGGATIAWTVTGPATPATGSGSEITLTGTGPSAEHGVIITATVNGTQVCQQFLTVLAPHSLLHQSDIDKSIPSNYPLLAYRSIITDSILDNLGHVLPQKVPVNEDIDGDGAASSSATLTAEAKKSGNADYTANPIVGWKWGDEEGSPYQPTNCFDTITRIDDGTYVPNVLNPQYSTVKVEHLNGCLYVGSTSIAKGVKVQTLTWQIYQDHARHENTKTP